MRGSPSCLSRSPPFPCKIENVVTVCKPPSRSSNYGAMLAKNTKEAIVSKIMPAFVALPVLALMVLVGISVPGNATDATDVSSPYAPPS